MAVITSSGRGVAVVVNRDRTTAVLKASTDAIRVRDAAQVHTIEQRADTVAIATPGVQGPKGDPGLSPAGLLPPINFAFGDATPATVAVLSDASEVMAVQLQIEEAFNGVGATIALGTAEDPELLLAAWQSDPSDAGGVFEVCPRVELPANTNLVLTIAPGAGATQGRGQLVLSAVPTT